jgi:hypothetical protein
VNFWRVVEFAKNQFPGKIWIPLCLASFGTGFCMTMGMAPIDVVATRYYNQGTDASGKGKEWKGYETDPKD